MNLQVHYVLDRCRGNSIAYGQKMLSGTLFNEIYEAERKSTQNVKRVHEEDVRVMVLPAPNLQAVRLDSVPADKNWRSGEDTCPSNGLVETNLPGPFAASSTRSVYRA